MYLKIFIICLLLSSTLRAQTIDVLFEGQSERGIHTQAQKEIVDSAVKETSLKYIAEIIGEAKTNRNKALIENKVIKQSGKYVLYIKTDKISRDEENPKLKKLNVSLKVSLDNLRKILLSNGLLYKTEGSPKVLPLIVFDDRKNSESFIWWANSPSSDFLKQTANTFYSQVRKSFQEKLFFSAMPVQNGLVKLIPEQLQLENPRLEDSLVLGEYFSSDIIVKGKVQFKAVGNFSDQNEVAMQLTAYQASNGRLIADVKRKYKTEFGAFKNVITKKMAEISESVSQDLVSQVYSAWQSGTFGSSLIRLTLYGPIEYRDLMDLKEKFGQLKEVRRIRERFFARKKVSFEIDASVLPQDLANIIKSVKTDKYALKLDDVEAKEIEFDLVSR